jgi:carbon storage regulator
MLVLSRNQGQSIIIQTSDGEIEVFINAVNGGQVKVGIQAPDNVDIWRSELLEDVA